MIYALILDKEPFAWLYGVKYITLIAWFTPLIDTNFIALGIILGTDDIIWSLKINVSVQFINLIFNALLIFELLGFQRLETMGAGLTVGIVHAGGFFMGIYVLRKRKCSLVLIFMKFTGPFKYLVKGVS